MEYIMSFLNTITRYTLGGNYIISPADLLTRLAEINVSVERPLSAIVAELAKHPDVVLSYIVWALVAFGFVIVAIVAPYKMIRAIVKKAGGRK